MFYHVGFAVPDLQSAMQTFTDTSKVTWNAPATATLGRWQYQIVFTTTAPFIELISGPVGSPWDTSESGPRFDHLGWWTDSLDHAVPQWTSCQGVDLGYDGRREGRSFAYFDANALGIRLELVDSQRMSDFLAAWSPDEPQAMQVPKHAP